MMVVILQDTVDESHWQRLNRTLRRVSSTTNGKYDAVQEIVVLFLLISQCCIVKSSGNFVKFPNYGVAE